MPVYIALLRGINIGPRKRMKMEKLVAACAACGWKGAKTYIQSGNVVFKATGRSSPDALGKKLAAQIVADFGFSADVILRSQDELEGIIKTNPLLKQRGLDPEKLHVAFLAEQPQPDAVKKLESLTLAPD
ncbi:MAG TPA: DUF1697 domain-containing protein, partial [Candidatus Sulfopaludibacter sp.]|nr:DUF1697 domain-containing protein [Candidatus Sulfopaludibacter sp.]